MHTALLKNRVFESLNAVVEDADIDALDEEIARPESTKAKSDGASVPAVAAHDESLVQPSKVVVPSHNPSANTGK